MVRHNMDIVLDGMGTDMIRKWVRHDTVLDGHGTTNTKLLVVTQKKFPTKTRSVGDGLGRAQHDTTRLKNGTTKLSKRAGKG